MALNFPSNPRVGDSYSYKGVTYVFNGVGWAPQAIPTPTNAPVYVSDVPPHHAVQGDLWYQSGTGTLWVYYCDFGGCQWVTCAPLPDGVLTTAGNFVIEGPVYLAAPIDPSIPSQAINVGYVADVVRAGNGVTIAPVTNTVQTIDCGTFLP